MELISRQEAKAQGLLYYYTGKPCLRGHVSERFTYSGHCSACDTERSQTPEHKAKQAAYYRTPERKARVAAYYKTPEAKGKKAAYDQTPEAKAKQAVRRQTPENKAKKAATDAAYIKANPKKVAARRLAYYTANKENILAKNALWTANNPEKAAENLAKWRAKNRAQIAANKVKYVEANRSQINAMNAQRRAAKLERTPKWLTSADKAKIKAIYEQCAFTSRVTGEPHHVDHIIPLQGEAVSGLHVPSNLQILTAAENVTKSNKLLDDHFLQ